MSEPIKAADVINQIYAGLAKYNTQDINTMRTEKLEAIIAKLACPENCPCKAETE